MFNENHPIKIMSDGFKNLQAAKLKINKFSRVFASYIFMFNAFSILEALCQKK